MPRGLSCWIIRKPRRINKMTSLIPPQFLLFSSSRVRLSSRITGGPHHFSLNIRQLVRNSIPIPFQVGGSGSGLGSSRPSDDQFFPQSNLLTNTSVSQKQYDINSSSTDASLSLLTAIHARYSTSAPHAFPINFHLSSPVAGSLASNGFKPAGVKCHSRSHNRDCPSSFEVESVFLFC